MQTLSIIASLLILKLDKVNVILIMSSVEKKTCPNCFTDGVSILERKESFHLDQGKFYKVFHVTYVCQKGCWHNWTEYYRLELKDFNLEHVKDQKAYTLSGGERRRVEIARALISEPKFLLLDEPFTGIDPISRTELQELILTLKKKGIGILISDHNVRETLEITDRAYLIYDAKVLLSGDAQTLINDANARKLYLGEKFKI